jgi:hypothetical protein
MSTKTEVWKPVPGLEKAYFVSNLGKVKSLARRVKCGPGAKGTRCIPEKILRPDTLRKGYKRVNLCGCKITVHQLVLQVFVGKCPAGCEVRRIDGNPANNMLTNLRYGTHAQNMLDRNKHGTGVRGERSSTHKLEAADVSKLRRMYGTGKYTLTQLSAKFGLSISGTRAAARGINWKHLVKPVVKKIKLPSGMRAGERNSNSKLTSAKVIKIRALYATSMYTQSRLGRLYNVSDSAIRSVLAGTSWNSIK